MWRHYLELFIEGANGGVPFPPVVNFSERAVSNSLATLLYFNGSRDLSEPATTHLRNLHKIIIHSLICIHVTKSNGKSSSIHRLLGTCSRTSSFWMFSSGSAFMSGMSGHSSLTSPSICWIVLVMLEANFCMLMRNSSRRTIRWYTESFDGFVLSSLTVFLLPLLLSSVKESSRVSPVKIKTRLRCIKNNHRLI